MNIRPLVRMTAATLCTAASSLLLCSAEPDNPAAPGLTKRLLFPIVKDGKWGYMDEKGKVVIEPQYQLAWDFSEGLACVGLNALRGYIDETGKMVIAPQFGWAGRFSEGLARVNLHKSKYGEHVEWYRAVTGVGYCDRSGKVTIRLSYGDKLSDFSEGLAWTSRGYLDKDGKQVPFEGEEGSPFAEGMAAAHQGALWGYIERTTMKFAIPPKFTEARRFSEDFAAVAVAAESDAGREKDKSRQPLKWGYIDKTGKTVIEPRFEAAGRFSEGLAPVKLAGKWGYIDKTGSAAVQPQYDYVWPFSEGKGRVLSGEKHGYVDRQGRLAIEPKFDAAWEFSHGLARVGIGEKEGYIDHSGSFVWEPTE